MSLGALEPFGSHRFVVLAVNLQATPQLVLRVSTLVPGRYREAHRVILKKFKNCSAVVFKAALLTMWYRSNSVR